MQFQRLVKPLLVAGLLLGTVEIGAASSPMAQLGKKIFFDANLSDPAGQSCASCHQPEAGWAGPDSAVNAAGSVYPGAVHQRAGNRKPPSAAYATFSPRFHFDKAEEHFVGGNFWDGRATGWLLGSPTADQAQGPFLNPVEQNNPDAKAVVDKVCAAYYAKEFTNLFGAQVCNNPLNAYNAIAQAIATFEASPEVNAFTSKYDYYLKDADRYPLSDQERLGLELYERADKGNCAACHPNQPTGEGEPPLFTDFTYDNLGIPKNPDNPWYGMPQGINPEGSRWIDPGLGGFLKRVPRYAQRASENLGKHRVPTLRNLDLRPYPEFVKAYGHNGYFKSIEDFIRFYNTRDVLAACEGHKDPKPNVNCWPAPEVVANINREELGKLGLSETEEQAIVAFLKTLNDGWTPGPSQESR